MNFYAVVVVCEWDLFEYPFLMTKKNFIVWDETFFQPDKGLFLLTQIFAMEQLKRALLIFLFRFFFVLPIHFYSCECSYSLARF